MASFKQIKNHFEFSAKEISDFNITTLLTSLIFFFFIWAFADLNLVTGILTFIYSLVICAFSLFVFIASAKAIAILRATTAEYSCWTMGSLIAFIISYLSYGFVPLVFSGNLDIKAIPRLKHGEVFHSETKKDIFFILFSTILIQIVLILFLHFIYLQFPTKYIYYILVLNAFMIFVNLLPFPRNIGAQLFYVRKKSYFAILFMSLFLLIAVLIKFKYIFLVALLGLILGTIISKQNKLYYILDTKEEFDKRAAISKMEKERQKSVDEKIKKDMSIQEKKDKDSKQ